jgi:hypothetical protein
MKLIAFLLACVATGALAADEIAVTARMEVNNGDFSLTRSVQALKVDQASQRADMGIQASASTTTNTIPVRNCAVGGYSFLRNLGTNTITVQVNVLMKASDVAMFRVASTNVKHFTTGGPGVLEYWINAE